MAGSSGAAAASSRTQLKGDRFYYPPHRRQTQQHQQQGLQSRRPPTSPSLSPSPSPRRKAAAAAAAAVASVDADGRADSDDSSSTSSKPSLASTAAEVNVMSSAPAAAEEEEAGNLDRFLASTTPSVPVRNMPETSLRMRRSGDAMDSSPYFCLDDLWESFREWSAYGAGVPLVLNGGDSVIQYYVPYLSAIQLYADPSRPVASTSSESSSETDAAQNGVLQSEDGDAFVSASFPIFEHLERDSPYGREPLTDKVSVLADRFPALKTFRSCDLLPSSWMSVAWYPIYRIPTGPTLKDLEACFLTFHCLATPSKDSHPTTPACPGFEGIGHYTSTGRLSLPAFGLASYKLRSSLWASNGAPEQESVTSLMQEADNWLRCVQVDHPDFQFFVSHFGATWR
ncbi:uncharacterized protein LOC123453168 isoform X2 [Hordeum vulgare subsp. vulgare]|uniref:Uncharacterized protein n=1 Tax=Hordeum vulgare subsp. vulgare TaxID=112509 RepID=A0A8I6YNE5_HORVV|nr:uncharacterized protein LOC123453168 isoform X2 [Hordeum vulgare subsp. vulgare]